MASLSVNCRSPSDASGGVGRIKVGRLHRSRTVCARENLIIYLSTITWSAQFEIECGLPYTNRPLLELLGKCVRVAITLGEVIASLGFAAATSRRYGEACALELSARCHRQSPIQDAAQTVRARQRRPQNPPDIFHAGL